MPGKDKRGIVVFSGVSQRTKFLYGSAFVLLVGVYIWQCLAVNYIMDDSFITFRYARNFVNGHGLVFNPGERVEGYTNFLWTMLLSGFIWINPQGDLLHAAQALGTFFGIATLLLISGFSWVFHGKISLSGLIGAAFLAVNSGFCAWSTGGLETMLFTFLVFGGSISYISSLRTGKRFLVAPVLLALAAMTRPEGILFFGMTSVHLAVTEIRSGRRLISRRTTGWFFTFAAIYAPYYFWRFAYYGYPFPNTFYTKVGTGIQQYLRGLRYLVNYGREYGVFVFLIPLPLLFKRSRKTWVDFFFLLVGGYVAYVIYVGGDGLGFFRFIVPVTPFIYLMVQEGFRELNAWGKRHLGKRDEWKIALVTAPLLIVSLGFSSRQSLGVLAFPGSHRWHEPQSELSFPGNGKDHSYTWFDNYFVDRLAVAARWLDTNAPPGALVASTPAGSIGYYMNLRVLDMLGLNDLHIAHIKRANMGGGRAGHEKGDGKYVLSRSPDYILLGNVAVLPRPLGEAEMEKKLVQKSEREIWADPNFHKKYERTVVKLSDKGVFKYFTFYKKRSSDSIQHGYRQQKLSGSTSLSQQHDGSEASSKIAP